MFGVLKILKNTRVNKVKNKVCSLIINWKYWINMASTLLVKKLGLPVLKHLQPYLLDNLDDTEFEDMVLRWWPNKCYCHSHLQNIKMKYCLMWCLLKSVIFLHGLSWKHHVKQTMTAASTHTHFCLTIVKSLLKGKSRDTEWEKGKQ